MGLNGIHKHAIPSISNKITFLCDLYLSMSSLTMWVFDLSSSLDFLSLLFLTKLFTSISKEIYCGHINHRKLFQCCFMIDDKEVKESRFACGWFAVWAWWMLSFSYFQKMWIALTLYLIWRVLQIWTVVISLNDHINHRKSIAYIGIYVKLLFVIRFITYYIHVLL